MTSVPAILLIVWALGSWLLWQVQSHERYYLGIDWRDRAVALFWLPMLLFGLCWGGLLHAADLCRARWGQRA